jgi:uncharacterized protein (DUF983 family)
MKITYNNTDIPIYMVVVLRSNLITFSILWFHCLFNQEMYNAVHFNIIHLVAYKSGVTCTHV